MISAVLLECDAAALRGPVAGKFKGRYAMFGFNDRAKLDDGSMWPVAFALTKLTRGDEARIAKLVKKAVS